jgi:hydroxymethylpyrimidine/phosphomethylpyrimidine kinase
MSMPGAILPTTLPAVLSIAGSDSSGGAGIQADLKTMMANGVYGMSAITALTAQNTTGIMAQVDTPTDMIAAQIDMVWNDIAPMAVKIGMLPNESIVEVIASRLTVHQASNIVVDPVMISSSGTRLMSEHATEALKQRLFPIATLITPNIAETEALLSLPAGRLQDRMTMEQAARALSNQYHCAVLVKGGHRNNDSDDVLAQGETATWFTGERVDNPNSHGTGCTLSSAIASNLAKGTDMQESVKLSKRYLTGCLRAQLDLGSGSGPLDHAWQWRNEYE